MAHQTNEQTNPEKPGSLSDQEAALARPANPIRPWETLFRQLANGSAIRTQLLTRWGEQAWTRLEARLSRHPFLQERATFQKRYTYALWYYALKAAQNSSALPHISFRELARTLRLPSETLRMWMTGLKQPDLLCTLTLLDEARHQREVSLRTTAGCQHADPSEVYHAFKPFFSHAALDDLTPASLAVAIEKLSRSVPNSPRLLLVELRPYHRSGPGWFRSIAKEIKTRRSAIQERLARIASHRDLHIGIVNRNLYIWYRDNDPDDWLNIWAHELFHFENAKRKNEIVEEALHCLNDVSIRKLSELVHQMTHHPRWLAKEKTPLTDLRRGSDYLVGESLHLVLDATGRSLQNISIRAVGRGAQGYGRVSHPRFPQGESLEEFRARALAIMLSDGHLDEERVLSYLGDEPDRVQYIKGLFTYALGVIDDNILTYTPRVVRLRFPAIVGRILESWGMPVGDKPLRRFRLPDAVRNGTTKVRCAYIEEVIPEEGYFIVSNSGRKLRAGIGRTVVLDAGPKAQRYGFSAKISPEQKETLKELLETHSRSSSRRALVSGGRYLTWAELRDAARDSKKPEIRVRIESLAQLVSENPPELLFDERALFQNLGVDTRISVIRINLYRSGRVSVAWAIDTRSTNDAIRWILLAPPSPGRKRKRVNEWCTTHPQRVQLVKQRL